MSVMSRANLYRWCSVPARDLPTHADLRVRFRMVRDSAEMGMLMARQLADEIEGNNKQSRPTRAIIPCGPKCWYAPFTELVNARKVSLRSLFVFHMDECLDWQGRPLPARHPYNFRSFMEEHFYGGVLPALAVPHQQARQRACVRLLFQAEDPLGNRIRLTARHDMRREASRAACTAFWPPDGR